MSGTGTSSTRDRRSFFGFGSGGGSGGGGGGPGDGLVLPCSSCFNQQSIGMSLQTETSTTNGKNKSRFGRYSTRRMFQLSRLN